MELSFSRGRDYDETWVMGPASQPNIGDRPTGTNTKQTSNKCRDVGQLPNSPQNQSQSASTFYLPLSPGFQMKQWKENLSFKQNGAKLKLTEFLWTSTTWLHLLFSARSCTATCHVLETTQVGFSEFQVGYLRVQFAALSFVWIAGNSIKIRGQKCIRVTVIMPIIIIL